MKVKVNFFKKSGKWYTEEVIDIPDGAQAWTLIDYLPQDRLREMVAVTEGDTPWGYPALAPARDEGLVFIVTTEDAVHSQHKTRAEAEQVANDLHFLFQEDISRGARKPWVVKLAHLHLFQD